MAKYIIHFTANPQAWPTHATAAVELWEGTASAATALLDAGTLSTIDWTSNMEGYATLEAASQAVAIQVAAAFFPFFTQTIEELVPWSEASAAILAGGRAAAEG